MINRKIVTVITDALGDRVSIGKQELEHAIKRHFRAIPEDIILELLERILRDPSEVYRDARKREQILNFFYRIEKGPKFIVAVVKVTSDGAFFSSMYPTGKSARNTHKNYKKVKI